MKHDLIYSMVDPYSESRQCQWCRLCYYPAGFLPGWSPPKLDSAKTDVQNDKCLKGGAQCASKDDGLQRCIGSSQQNHKCQPSGLTTSSNCDGHPLSQVNLEYDGRKANRREKKNLN